MMIKKLDKTWKSFKHYHFISQHKSQKEWIVRDKQRTIERDTFAFVSLSFDSKRMTP